MTRQAISITENNRCIIISEGGRRLDKDELDEWLSAEREGYFVRDEGGAFDCVLIDSMIFPSIYKFRYKSDEGDQFREIDPS